MTTLSSQDCRKCGGRLHSVFCHLRDDLVEVLNQSKKTFFYKKKQVVYHEGTEAIGAYCVFSGRVKVYKSGTEGRQHILEIAGPHDMIGLDAAFYGRHYPSTAEVIEPGVLCFISKSTIHHLIEKDPTLTEDIIMSLAKELRASNEERVELAQGRVRERLARLLLQLSHHYGTVDKTGTRITLKLSREEIAEMIGSAPETTVRFLKEFREGNLLAIHGKEIIILDKNGLEATASLSTDSDL